MLTIQHVMMKSVSCAGLNDFVEKVETLHSIVVEHWCMYFKLYFSSVVELNEQFLNFLKPNRPQYREMTEECWPCSLMKLHYLTNNYSGKS
jgi:hypothetical protein